MKTYEPEKALTQEYTLVIPPDSLRFESRFESGNLSKAIRLSDSEYNLVLDYDTETQSYTQWYHFSVKGATQGKRVRFNIVNLLKYESLYNNGLKPLVYSTKRGRWQRDGSSISYYQNTIPRPSDLKTLQYTLTFSYTFQENDDTVYFAHCFPYTYTALMHDLRVLALKHPSTCRLDILCKTLGGNDCPVITITQNIETYQSWSDELNRLAKTSAARRLLRAKELRQMAQRRHIDLYRKGKVAVGKG
jgi:hypothetical protein